MTTATDHPDVVPVTPTAEPGTITLPPTEPSKRRRGRAAPPAVVPDSLPALGPSADIVAAMRQEIQTEQAIHEMVEELVLKFLKPGEDYGISHAKHCQERANATPFGGPGRCPKCHRKPDLWLPGAEKITKRLGFAFGLPEVADDIMRAVHIEVPWIAFRVALINKRTGEVAGHGIGAQTLLQADGDPNKMIKMGKKSSIIDCAKTNFALSAFFTQDSEAVDRPDAPPAGGPPAPTPIVLAKKVAEAAAIDALATIPTLVAHAPPATAAPIPPAQTPVPAPSAPIIVKTPTPISVGAPENTFTPTLPPPIAPTPAAAQAPTPTPAPKPTAPTPVPVPVVIKDRATPSLDRFVSFYAIDGTMLQRLYWCAGWSEGAPITEVLSRSAYTVCDKLLSNWIQAHGGWPPEAKDWTAEERRQHVFEPWLQGLEVFYRQNPTQRGIVA